MLTTDTVKVFPRLPTVKVEVFDRLNRKTMEIIYQILIFNTKAFSEGIQFLTELLNLDCIAWPMASFKNHGWGKFILLI